MKNRRISTKILYETMPKASKTNYYDYDARKTTPVVPEYHQNIEALVPLKPKKKKPVDKLAGLLEGLSM
jgi:hypothetical protein